MARKYVAAWIAVLWGSGSQVAPQRQRVRRPVQRRPPPRRRGPPPPGFYVR
jgi:hypothetical protein